MGLQGSRSLRRRVASMQRDLDRKPDRTISREASRTVNDMKRRVVEQDAVASTELYRGIGYRSIGDTYVIHSSAGHSGFVEFGTGVYSSRYDAPDFSPQLVAALVDWSVIKPSLLVDDPVSFGYAVARHVAGVAEGSVPGTEPQPFFFETWDRRKHSMIAAVRDAVSDSV